MTGPARIAETLLRTLGGRTVLLHMPKPAIAGDLGEELGLAQPQFQEAVLGPVAFRRKSNELLVSASAVARLTGSLAFDSARVLFNQAAGILIDGMLYPVKAVSTAEAFGQVYLYRVELGDGFAQGGSQ